MKYIPTSIVSDKQLNPVGPSFFLNHPLTLVQGQSNLAGALLELSLGQVQSSGYAGIQYRQLIIAVDVL